MRGSREESMKNEQRPKEAERNRRRHRAAGGWQTRATFGCGNDARGTRPLKSRGPSNRVVGCPLLSRTLPRSNRCMQESLLGRANRRFGGVLCVLVAAGCLAPRPARAGCGHGVTSEAGRRLQGAVYVRELAANLIVDPASGRPAVPHHDPPCSAPSCSRGQAAPQAPAVISTVASDPMDITAIARRWRGPAPSVELADCSTPQPRLSTSPIERPPRIEC
jgi:hypothetical protein